MAYTTTQLQTFFTNANAGTGPTAAQTLTLTALSNQNAAGTLTDAQALAQTIDLASDTTTAVSVETYQFFTGVAPSQAGLTFLNAAFTGTGAQASLNGENRFIAQSVALALGNTAAKTSFSATYGSLSVADATKAAYNIIVGNAAAAAAGINVDAAVGFLTSASSIAYYSAYVKANLPATTTAADLDLALKAAIIGEIMYTATTFNNGAGVGSYATATTTLIKDLADDGALVANSSTGIDLFANYGQTGVGNGGVTATAALTTAIDALNGTSVNDIYTGVISATAASNTVNLGDSINGGGGNNVLNLIADGTFAVPAITLSNVQTVNVNETVNGQTLTVSANGWTGVTNINATGIGNTTFTNFGSATIGANNSGLATGQTATVTAAGAANLSYGGSAGAGTLNVDISGGAQPTTVNMSTVTGVAGSASATTLDAATTALVIKAAANLGTGTLTATGLKTVVASGAATTVNLGTLASTNLVSVDGSGLTAGGLTVGLGAATGATFKGGAGADTVTISAGTVMTGIIDAGAGTDILSISQGVAAAGGAVASTSLTNVTKPLFLNFETLRVASTVTGAGAQTTADVATFSLDSAPAGITALQVGTSTAGVNLTNVTTQATTVVGNITGAANGGLIITLKDASGAADSTAVALTGTGTTGRSVNLLTTAGVETLNLSSTGGTGASQNTISGLSDTSLTKVNITGSGVFNLTTGALTSAVTSIDGQAATGALTIDASGAGASKAVNINGGTANDTITAAAQTTTKIGQAIYGGTGGDVITLGTHAGAAGTVNTLVYKTAADSLYDVLGTAGASTTTTANTGKMDSIGGFVSGQDKIDVTSFGLTTAQLVITDKGTLASTDAMAALSATADFYKDVSSIQRGIAEVHVGTDTYLFVDANKDGLFNAGTDLVIKLTGSVTVVNGDLIGS